MATRGKPELSEVIVTTSGIELGEAMGSIWPTAHEGVKGNGFGGNSREDIKGVSGNDVGEVRDHSNAVPGIRSIVGRRVSRQGSMRKSRGRVRT